jgi:5'(3')-deoxyribonucleotidase
VKKTLAVDLDDVLSESFASIIAYHNATYGTSHVASDMTDHNLNLLWGTTKEEAIRLVDEWFNSPFYMQTGPVGGAHAGLTALKNAGFSIIVITSRPLRSRRHTETWLEQNYAGLYNELYITDQYANPDAPITKGSICADTNAVGLVDDVITYLEDVASKGMRAFQYDTPWNQHESSPRVTRVHSWDDVVTSLLA